MAVFGYVAQVCNAHSVQISQSGNMMRTEAREEAVEARLLGWPRWEQYFPTLENLTFVQIGANNGLNKGSVQGDPIWDYATKHHWKGYAVEPNPNSFKELRANYKQHPSVTPLEFAVSDKDGLVDLFVGSGSAAANEANTILPGSNFVNTVQVKSMTLPSLWKTHVVGKLPKVDILVVDVEGAEPKLLKGTLTNPKPRFILFEYYHLARQDYKAIGTNLEEHGYKYVGRDGGDELHELVHP